ncbi:DoxX family protein [Parabacteroides pacaensis]|uniref:DoxX family protein n=1 Tax=Parabacteroides pacaensis TaxID=2086575 RepID=UPI000D101B00|nr:DoxX family protein [Parabacteroides pacaensis]
MKALYRFLFPMKPEGTGISWILLAVRIIFGLLLMTHGMAKWNSFSILEGNFPDPLHIGSQASLASIIFVELVCSIGFILGALYRLVLIPMIFSMGVAFFIIHGADAFHVKELAFIYLVVFIIMYIVGPGKYSVDRYLAVRVS